MSLLDTILAMSAEKMAEEAPKPAPKAPAKRRVRVTWDATGKIEWPSEKKPASNVAVLLKMEQDSHQVGGSCPHCGGRGRYFIHIRRSWEKCYRCNGKGTLDGRDMAFYDRRLANNEPLSRVYGGV